MTDVLLSLGPVLIRGFWNAAWCGRIPIFSSWLLNISRASVVFLTVLYENSSYLIFDGKYVFL